MKKIHLFPTLLALSLIIFLSSCQSEPRGSHDALGYLPENTEMVTAINIKNMMDKARFGQVVQMEFYQEILKEARGESPVIAGILEKPERSGVDLDKNVYVSQEMNPEDGTDRFMTAIFSLKDVEAFEKMMEEVDFQVVPASRNFSYSSPDSRTILAWNESVLIFGAGKTKMDLEEKMESYFNRDPDNSIANNKNLQKCLSGDFDVANWTSTKFFLEGVDTKSIEFFANLDKVDVEDNYMHNLLNFEDGEVTVHTDLYIRKKLMNDLSLFLKKEVKTDFVAALPAEDLIGFATGAMDLKGINQVLIEKYSKGLADQGLDKFGIKTNDLKDALNGDVAVAMYATNGMHRPKMIVGMGVADREKLDQMIQAGTASGIFEKHGENLYKIDPVQLEVVERDSVNVQPVNKANGFFLVQNDKVFMLDGQETVDYFQSSEKGPKNVEVAIGDLIGAHSFSGFASVNGLKNLDQRMELIEFESIRTWGNLKTIDTVMKTEDDDVNSLHAIFKQLNEEFLERQGEKVEEGQKI